MVCATPVAPSKRTAIPELIGQRIAALELIRKSDADSFTLLTESRLAICHSHDQYDEEDVWIEAVKGRPRGMRNKVIETAVEELYFDITPDGFDETDADSTFTWTVLTIGVEGGERLSVYWLGVSDHEEPQWPTLYMEQHGDK